MVACSQRDSKRRELDEKETTLVGPSLRRKRRMQPSSRPRRQLSRFCALSRDSRVQINVTPASVRPASAEIENSSKGDELLVVSSFCASHHLRLKFEIISTYI